jgi:hypothetical protein
MEYHYDEGADILTLNFGDADVAIVDDSPEHAGVIMEYTADRKLVNIRLLETSKCVDFPARVKFIRARQSTGEAEETEPISLAHRTFDEELALYIHRPPKPLVVEPERDLLANVLVHCWYNEGGNGLYNSFHFDFRKASYEVSTQDDFDVYWDLDSDEKPFSMFFYGAPERVADPEYLKSLRLRE